MPTPAAETPLRVAECNACGKLFALYAQEGAVACPECSKTITLEGLEVAELNVAQPVEINETVVATPKPPEPAVAEDRPPTVAEWLTREDPPSVEPATDQSATPSLAESLGWSPGSFQIDESRSSVPRVEQPQTSSSDAFRIDLNETPLTEQLESIPPKVDSTQLPPVEEQTDNPRKGSRTWSLVTAAAVLAAIGGGAYTLLKPGSESLVTETANRESLVSLPEEEPTPPNPFPMEITTDEEQSAPIIDPQTTPAGFNSPQRDLPPLPPAEKPASETPMATSEPPADPFLSQAPATSAPAEDRYAISADTYADLPDLASTEPVPTTPPEPAAFDSPASTPIASEPPATVRLNNPQPTSLADLTAAITDAAPAGRGFVDGSLSDPEQVSTMGQHYARLCFLAQSLTLLENRQPGQPTSMPEMEAADVFTRLFQSQNPRVQSRQIAGPWIAWDGRPHGGVFFAGEPTGVAPAGEATEYTFQLGETTVPVIMAEPIDPQRYVRTAATEVGVIGIVVDEPTKWIAGYQGEHDRVVWARTTIPLSLPTE